MKRSRLSSRRLQFAFGCMMLILAFVLLSVLGALMNAGLIFVGLNFLP